MSPGPGPSPSQIYFLTTRRLGFRHWTESDLRLAIVLWGDPKVTKHIDERGHLSDARVFERLELEMHAQQIHGVQYWPVFLLGTHEHIGVCGLRPRDIANGGYELGIHIRPGFWRQGFATEAARAVIDLAFKKLKAKELFAGHNPANKPSGALVLKLGFKYVGDEPYPPTGLMHPSYVLKADEYQFRRPMLFNASL
jgi:ribosomal-protein-alanine N-acetyltransferase